MSEWTQFRDQYVRSMTPESLKPALASLKRKLKAKVALDGADSLMWLGENESLARYLTADDWAEIYAEGVQNGTS